MSIDDKVDAVAPTATKEIKETFCYYIFMFYLKYGKNFMVDRFEENGNSKIAAMRVGKKTPIGNIIVIYDAKDNRPLYLDSMLRKAVFPRAKAINEDAELEEERELPISNPKVGYKGFIQLRFSVEERKRLDSYTIKPFPGFKYPQK